MPSRSQASAVVSQALGRPGPAAAHDGIEHGTGLGQGRGGSRRPRRGGQRESSAGGHRFGGFPRPGRQLSAHHPQPVPVHLQEPPGAPQPVGLETTAEAFQPGGLRHGFYPGRNLGKVLSLTGVFGPFPAPWEG
jgi:hypothetical protein